MNPPAGKPSANSIDPAGDADLPREVWSLISNLVLDNQERRQVADATGISFGRSGDFVVATYAVRGPRGEAQKTS